MISTSEWPIFWEKNRVIRLIYIIFTCLLLLSRFASGLKWLTGLYSDSTDDNSSSELFCDNLKGLNRRQIEICKRNFELMEPALHGTRLAVAECEFLFVQRRWNCSGLGKSMISASNDNRKRSHNRTTNIPPSGTREAAFVHALISASISYSVTKACSRGDLATCGCDQSDLGPAKDFQWEGCSDNIHFGLAFSKAFMDARELAILHSNKHSNRMKARAAVNLHNNYAGRQVAIENVRLRCKCHGISGSCDLKTCWKVHPSIRTFGKIFRNKFDTAREVKADWILNYNGKDELFDILNEERSNTLHGSKSDLRPVKSDSKQRNLLYQKRDNREDNRHSGYLMNFEHNFQDLIYIRPSVNYCEPDEKHQSFGTHGRACNRSSIGPGSCEHLCCDRGFQTKMIQKEYDCLCEFTWCCEVQCKKCLKQTQLDVCL
ncbi:protein Wnt-4-like [Brevipalpus obovatus]|uniref:protein Wnt-4-like n=1 Tax=Brevipalpus obovatus TaxID=246614 RepID=UPI003D9EC7D7